MKRIDEIRARLEAATPGPWKYDLSYKRGNYEAKNWNWARLIGPDQWVSEPSEEYYIERGFFWLRDAQLIAHAPADLRALLDALDVAVEALERVGKGHTIYRFKNWQDEYSGIATPEILVTPETESARAAITRINEVLDGK